jgi:RimJ/RimL family protein N-acetyltransferase
MVVIHAVHDRGLQVRDRSRQGGPVRFPDDVPVLTDGTATLRAHRTDDVPGVLEQCQDPLSQRWTTVPVPYSRDHAEGFVTEVVPAGWSEGRWAFAVEAPDEDGVGRFCGTVELRDEGSRRAEVAYGAHPWARGRGIVERALRLLLEWGFHDRHLRTVIWWANRGNWASRRTAWKLGFSCDGVVERWLVQRGDLLDAWVGVLHVDDERSPRSRWLEVPVLDGPGTRLRALSDVDVPRIVEACADARTGHWLWRVPRPYTDAHARAWLLDRAEHLASGSALTWAVADPHTGLLLGCVSASAIKPGRDAEIGYWAHPDARHRGVMTEACGLAVRHCFTSYDEGGLGLVRVEASVAEGNSASRHVVEANGFRHVGRERRSLRLGDGSLADSHVYDRLVEGTTAR